MLGIGYNAQYKPYSFKDYLEPISIYENAYANNIASLDKIADSTNQFSLYIDPNSQAYKEYKDYNQKLSDLSDYWARNGMDMNHNINNITDLRRQYRDTMIPINTAASQLAEYTKQAANLTANGQVVYNIPTIDAIRKDPVSAVPSVYNPEKVYSLGVNSSKSMSGRTIMQQILNIDKYRDQLQTTKGFSEEQVQEMIQSPSIKNMIEPLLVQSGIDKNKMTKNEFIRAAQTALNGIYAGFTYDINNQVLPNYDNLRSVSSSSSGSSSGSRGNKDSGMVYDDVEDDVKPIEYHNVGVSVGGQSATEQRIIIIKPNQIKIQQDVINALANNIKILEDEDKKDGCFVRMKQDDDTWNKPRWDQKTGKLQTRGYSAHWWQHDKVNLTKDSKNATIWFNPQDLHIYIRDDNDDVFIIKSNKLTTVFNEDLGSKLEVLINDLTKYKKMSNKQLTKCIQDHIQKVLIPKYKSIGIIPTDQDVEALKSEAFYDLIYSKEEKLMMEIINYYRIKSKSESETGEVKK